MEMSQPGLEMSITLPCREHVRMPEPDVLILYSPKREQTLIENNSSPTAAHLVVDGPALAFHLRLSLGFLEHFSSFGKKRLSCFCTVSAPLWWHTACLGACQAKAASLLRHVLHAHPPQQSSDFLPPLPPPFSIGELLIDLGPFLKVAAL